MIGEELIHTLFLLIKKKIKMGNVTVLCYVMTKAVAQSGLSLEGWLLIRLPWEANKIFYGGGLMIVNGGISNIGNKGSASY